MRMLAVLDRGLGVEAEAEQVALADADLAHEAIGGGVAASDRELACRLLLDVDVENDAVGCRSGLGGDLHLFEVAQVFQPALGAGNEGPVVGVAFGDIELAPDHVITGADIAADIDLLDVDARPILDREGEVDSVGLRVAISARTHRHEGKTLSRRFDRHVLDGFLHRLGVENLARRYPKPRAHQSRIERAHIRAHIHRSNPELLAFFDDEFHHEAARSWIELDRRRHDAHIDVAVLQIEATQQLAISLDAIRIIDVVALQEREEPRLGRPHHLLEAEAGIDAVADELDAPDIGARALVDLEHEINAAVGQVDDDRIDANVIATAASIDLDDALDVGLDDRARQRATLARLDLKLELVVLDLPIALKRNAIDDRILGHPHDDPAARRLNADVLKQPRRQQRLIGFVDLEGPNSPVRSRLEIGADRIGLDPPISLNHDRVDGLCIGRS